MKTKSCFSLETHIKTLISLWRKTENNAPLSSKEYAQVSQALLNLQRGLTGDRKLAGSGYMDNSSLLGAYMLYYWPISYMQISYASSFAIELFQSITKKAESENRNIRILDIGSGPAPASCAIMNTLKDFNKFDITLADSSSSALELAKKIISKDFSQAEVKTIVSNFEQDESNKILFETKNNNFDIIVMCHALNELWKDKADCIERRKEFLSSISERLDSNGILFLCEPALLQTSRNLIKLRDALISNGFSIVSPCTQTQTQCPALLAGESHTCHAELLWAPIEPVASLAQKAGLDRESVKMTFFILKKNNNFKEEQNEINKQKANADYANKIFTGRVVSEGMLNKSGRIRFLLCDGKNRIPFSAKKDDAHAKQQGFFTLKRYDLVEINNPEERGDAAAKKEGRISFGIGKDTSISLANS